MADGDFQKIAGSRMPPVELTPKAAHMLGEALPAIVSASWKRIEELEKQLSAVTAEVTRLRAVIEAPPKFYVASRIRHAAMWQQFRKAGVPIISTWIDEAGECETEDFGELWSRIRDEINRSAGLILYAGPDDFPLKGAFVEVGMALAFGKPVRAVLPGVNVEGRAMRPAGSWLMDRNVQQVDSVDAACRELRAAMEVKA